MKEIPLTQGMVALVDDEDYEWLIQWKWQCMKLGTRSRLQYATRSEIMPNGKRRTICMHRVILNPLPKHKIDHINGNGLDNHKENLRIATHAQNLWNTGKYLNNTSGFKGVSWRKRDKRWNARINFNNQRISLGYFTDKLEAARAYNAAAKKYHGEFAIFNQEVVL